ncbi:hypothetical protein M8J76_002069 [Diaphorina citri]|nr:hypothetical protein M8J76_002069 [Diaphorina citri]KAI5754854.1 hypothetical protein M8J77_012087 [Diaphorina citri]
MNYLWLSIYHSSVELAPGGALENINDRDVQYVNGKVEKLNNEVELIHHYPQQLIPFPNNTAKFLSSIKRPGSTVIVLYVTRWLVTVKVRDRT